MALSRMCAGSTDALLFGCALRSSSSWGVVVLSSAIKGQTVYSARLLGDPDLFRELLQLPHGRLRIRLRGEFDTDSKGGPFLGGGTLHVGRGEPAIDQPGSHRFGRLLIGAR